LECINKSDCYFYARFGYVITISQNAHSNYQGNTYMFALGKVNGILTITEVENLQENMYTACLMRVSSTGSRSGTFS
jgi:hypothetical protein